jgi:transposase InsO family protein
VANRTPAAIEAAIVRIRQTIEDGKDPELRSANLGADTIAAELKRAEIEPPHRATINRVLQRHGLIRPRLRKTERRKLPDDYPWPQVGQQANALHAFDFVMRDLTGGGRIYGYHLLDSGRRWPFLRAEAIKSTERVRHFLICAWQEVGLPCALQIDNDILWNGGGRGQRVFRTIVRFCLALGVEVLFTPPYTPQANGLIESLNDLGAANFWRRTQFCNFEHVQTELPWFERYCRHRRPLTELEAKTADQIAPAFTPICLPMTFPVAYPKRIPLTAGHVHFVRKVAADGSFSILNETWTLDKQRWAAHTIRATIDTQAQQLFVYHHAPKGQPAQLIHQCDYRLPEEALPLDSAYQRPRHPLWLPP